MTAVNSFWNWCLETYPDSANFPTLPVSHDDVETMPGAILCEFPCKGNSIGHRIFKRRKSRSRFVRVSAPVVNVEIVPIRSGCGLRL